ncbi:hypothetical protein DY000_02054671 [Brassica cretica]|uniref:Uncharacterized protein n=1 Tax=Brassica cretica TaxID=69181 RepID=A0ABQ7A7D5_BRACR|nr:hypothetical protein DY000_02054671 [Brassica cretica]
MISINLGNNFITKFGQVIKNVPSTTSALTDARDQSLLNDPVSWVIDFGLFPDLV